MAQPFAATISEWVRQTKARQEAVFKESAQRAIEEMQRVGPSVANPGAGEGGRMPVDTGFLRASLTVSLGAPRAAFRDPPSGEAQHRYNPGPGELVIAGADISDRIFAVYSARYADVVNYDRQFVAFAADQWPQIVAQVCREARARAGQ